MTHLPRLFPDLITSELLLPLYIGNPAVCLLLCLTCFRFVVPFPLAGSQGNHPVISKKKMAGYANTMGLSSMGTPKNGGVPLGFLLEPPLKGVPG